MDGELVGGAVAQLRAAVDGLLDGDLAGLSSVAVMALLREVEVQRRRLDAVDVRVLAEVGERGVAGDYARSSTADLLVHSLRVSPGEAKARVARAEELGPRRELSGAPLPALLPAAGEALRAGEISVGHVAVISRCVDRIPADIAHEAVPVAERMLVDAARHEHPGALAKTAGMLLARLDPDGALADEREHERRRGFSLIKSADQSSRPTGRFDPELTAALEAILDSLAAPVPGADGMADDRSPAQRRHDALAEAAARLLRSGTLPATGGVPVTILLRTSVDDLRSPDGTAQTAHGDLWPVSRLRLSACEAEVVPVVFNEAGSALRLGRAQRLASRAQRLALIARDGGCCFPGCDRPAAWCEAHHVIPWVDGGPTDVENLCLLCRYHHREFAARGWAVEMGGGVPQWLPPPFIDLDRRPVRNTAHHLPDIEFRHDAA